MNKEKEEKIDRNKETISSYLGNLCQAGLIDLEKNIKNRVIEFEKENKVILDISVYPELKKVLENQRSENFNNSYYFPDTIAKLLLKAKENSQYYYFMTKLFTRWTQRYIDFSILNRIFIKKEFPEGKIKLITEDIIDEEVYSFCYENFISKDLMVDLSLEFNLIGDILGKVLGFAKKSKTPILMLNQRLVNDIKRLIPVFDTANTFVDKKRTFFRKFMPHLERTRGIRWFIGITVGTVISPAGFVLTVIDP